ncbi:hypothetical protein B0H16DRAFT_1546901 [Mycena metata]|uniref:Uncharacterized protein n=1 Tax=Mycena metata TaxID=1033252 RepID=A0AAD7N920_9AGAR|nr:hypothetical protein B0H16DRAFT_1546901 [Mycena metata]
MLPLPLRLPPGPAVAASRRSTSLLLTLAATPMQASPLRMVRVSSLYILSFFPLFHALNRAFGLVEMTHALFCRTALCTLLEMNSFYTVDVRTARFRP